MKQPRLDVRSGAACGARGIPVQANPWPFETGDHYTWLAEWHETRAGLAPPNSALYRRLRELAQQYRRQAAVVGSSGMQPGDGR